MCFKALIKEIYALYNLKMGLGLAVKQPMPGPAPWATVGWVMGRPLRGIFQPTGLG